jgi:hypothetical protein
MAEKPKGRVSNPHLVKLEEKPARTRRSVYTDIVQEFNADDAMEFAKVAEAKHTAVVSVKKAIAKLGLSDVISAYTANGEVILEKKTK